MEVTIEALEKILESLGIGTPIIEKFASKLEIAEQAVTDFGAQIVNTNRPLKEYITSMSNVIGTSDKLRAGTLESASAFDAVSDSLSKLIMLTTKFDAFEKLSVTGGSSLNSLGDQFEQLTSRVGGWKNLTKQLIGSGLSSIVELSEKGAKEFINNAASAQHLENSYISLMASTGQMNQLFTAGGAIISKLPDYVARYGANLTQAAQITGMTTKEIAQFSTALGVIPGVMNHMIETGQGSDKQMDSLTATMVLAKGAGRQVTDVISAMSTAYEDLSNPQGKVIDNAQKGAAMFVLMSEASNKLGLKFEDTQKYLNDVAGQFKMIGDNTQAATNILGRFTGALQSTGLTAKASMEIVTNMTHAIRGMEIGTKSLISMRTGGPGGLQGAFQIDNLVRQGKMDEVAKKLEQTLRQQFGGRIYSMQEAANSPQAASQFMRQRSLIQSGAFGGLAKSPEDATRLLEALKAGPAATSEAIRSAADATKDIAQKGEELQKTQVSLLSQMNSALDRSVVLQQVIALGTARSLIGNGNQALAKSYEASALASMNSIMEANQKGPASLDTQTSDQSRLAIADFKDVIPAFGEGVGTGLRMMKDGVTNVGSAIANLASKNLNQQSTTREVNSDIKNTNAATQRGNALQSGAREVQHGNTLQSQVQRVIQGSKDTTVKHEITNKPMDININVTTDKGLEVTTTTNYPDATVRNLAQGAKGWRSGP